MDQDRVAQSSDGHHKVAQSRMERDRWHGAPSDLNGPRAEKSGTDLGGVATGVTDQIGVVCNDGDSVQIWIDVDVS